MQAQKFSSHSVDSEEELGEDSVLLETPLEKIAPYMIFSDTFTRMSSLPSLVPPSALLTRPGLQRENPRHYTALAEQLSADEQSVIVSALAHAEVLRQQQGAADATGSAISPAANGGVS